MNILEEIQNCPVEWRELGDKNVAKLSRGKVMSKQFLEENKGDFPVYSSQTANNGEIGRISSFEYDGEYVTWTTDGANAGTVFYRKGKFSVTNVCGLIEINNDYLLTKFVYYYLTISTKKYVSSGMGNPKLMSNVMGKIKIPIPPLEIQEKIVQTLDKFTDYITELTSELTSRKKQYSFYRDTLLSFEDEVYQVEWKTLGELFVFKNGLNKGKEFFGSGTPIVNYTDVYKNKKISSDILKGKVRVSTEEIERYGLQKGDVFFTRTSETQDEIGKTSVLLDEVKDGVFSGFVLRARPITKLLLPEYCAYCFESTTFRRDIVRYSTYTTRALTNGSTLSKLKIPVPSLEIQSRIVQVLDNFDTVCHDLNIGLPKEIELRQKQYEYFREKLLTFVAEGEYTESRVEEWDNSAIIKLLQWVFGPIRVKLGAVVNLQRGKRLVRQQLATTGSFPVYQNSLTPLGYYTESNRVKNTSFVICAGAAGEIGYSAMDFWAADDVYTLETSDSISDKFMYYVLVSKQDRLKSQVRKASIPRLSKDAIDKITFYLPSITEQERIVSTLDNFNTLTNSLSEGLPKEIELRQKQYKYWREQLLNFTR
mgnify:CR=1 FL=1